MKVLIIGSQGQLGQSLRKRYANNKNIEFTFTTREQLDIANIESLEKHFQSNAYDFCVNCAAYTHVEKAENNRQEAYLINSESVKNLSEQCKKHNIILIHISTDYVFDGLKNEPYLEEDETNPINVYGKSKLEGEQHIQKILSQYYIIRTSWLYSIFKNNFLTLIVGKIKNNDRLTITTEQTGTPTSCDELAKFIYFIITNKADFGIYHFSAKGKATWFDFAKQISHYFPDYSSERLEAIKKFATQAQRPNYSVLDLKKTLKIYPKIKSWQQSISETISKIS